MSKLLHSCKETCSGWKQGYEEGAEELDHLRAINARLTAAIQAALHPLCTFYDMPLKAALSTDASQDLRVIREAMEVLEVYAGENHEALAKLKELDK